MASEPVVEENEKINTVEETQPTETSVEETQPTENIEADNKPADDVKEENANNENGDDGDESSDEELPRKYDKYSLSKIKTPVSKSQIPVRSYINSNPASVLI